MRDVQALTSRLAQFQIDSINVVTRAQFMPLFSRLGPYDTRLLERAVHRPPRRLFEYWGHAASLIDVTLQPLLRFRMQAGFRDVWAGVERVARDEPGPRRVRSQLRSRRAARSAPGRSRDGGGARPHQLGLELVRVKTVLEWLFYCGEVAVGLSQLPVRAGLRPTRAGAAASAVLAVPTPTPEESVIGLIRRAAQASGWPASSGLRDYFRTRPAMTRAAIATLVENGELIPVTVRPGSETPLLPVASGPAAASDRRPGAAQPVRLDGLRAERGWSACSTSSTGSRSTFRSRNASMATTSIRSCWMRSSSPGSISRPTASGCAAGESAERPGHGVRRGNRAVSDSKSGGVARSGPRACRR